MTDQVLQNTPGVQQIEFRAMGSQIMAAVESDDAQAAALLAEVPRWFAEWEQTLSRFKADSELSLLNLMGGSARCVPVGATLWRVLQLALAAAHDTDGLVTPTVLNALEAMGYSSSFETLPGRPALAVAGHSAAPTGEPPGNTGRSTATRPLRATDADSANPLTAWRRIRIYSETRAVGLPAGVRLDFGGIAKGWAADEAVARLAALGPALVDAGGDIAVSGPCRDGSGWPVGVDAPLGTPGDSQLALLDLRAGGVATSGRDYRRWQQGETWRHHIIDPRSGAPADTDVLAATVIAPSAIRRRNRRRRWPYCWAGRGPAWLEARPALAGLLALETGGVASQRAGWARICGARNMDLDPACRPNRKPRPTLRNPAGFTPAAQRQGCTASCPVAARPRCSPSARPPPNAASAWPLGLGSGPRGRGARWRC